MKNQDEFFTSKHNARILSESLERDELEAALRIAELNRKRAWALTLYSALLSIFAIGMLLLLRSAIAAGLVTSRVVRTSDFELVMISLPFLVLGIYLAYRSAELRRAARIQVASFDDALMNLRTL